MIGHSYDTISEEKTTQVQRDEFRLLTSSLMEEILFAKDVYVQHHPTYDILFYTTISGEQKTYYFDEELGIYQVDSDGEKDRLAQGERYESNLPMVMVERGIVRFNFYARELNVLLSTSVKPRTIGGE